MLAEKEAAKLGVGTGVLGSQQGPPLCGLWASLGGPRCWGWLGGGRGCGLLLWLRLGWGLWWLLCNCCLLLDPELQLQRGGQGVDYSGTSPCLPLGE